MTINELHNAVKVELDKTSSLELPAFEQEEIDYWLNRGIQRFVEDKVNKYITLSKQGQIISKILDDIAPLVTDSSAIVYNSGSLPADYMFILSAYIEISKELEDGTTVTDELVPCELINEADKFKYIETPTNKPYFDKPKYIPTADFGDNIIVDVFTTPLTDENVYITYVAEPTKVEDVTRTNEYTDLPENTHYNIVTLTALLMLENIESQRFQTNREVVDNEL